MSCRVELLSEGQSSAGNNVSREAEDVVGNDW
jgi:hypothetical protein